MYNGIGLQTARGSGTNGYIQTNKFFIKPRTNTAAPAPYDLDAAGSVGGVKKPNKDILEHDRKRRIELRLLSLQEALAEQGYTEEEIVERVAEARKGLEEEARVKAKEGDRAAMPAPSKRFSDTQSHQIAARKQKQLELFRNALGIKQVVEPLDSDQHEENQQQETHSLENQRSDEEKASEGKVSKDIIQNNETNDLMEEGEIRSSKKSTKEGFKHQKYNKDVKDDSDSDSYLGKQNTKQVDKSVKKLKRHDSDSDSDSDINLQVKKKLVGKQPIKSRRYESDDSKSDNYDEKSNRRGVTDRHRKPPKSHKTTDNEIGSGMKNAIKDGRYEKSSTKHDSEDSLSDTDREKENRGKVTKKHNNSLRRHDSEDSNTEIDEGKKNKRKIMEKQKNPSRRHDSEESLSEADDEKNNKRKMIDTRSKPRRRYDSEDSLSETDKRMGRKITRDIIHSKRHDKTSRRHDSENSQSDTDDEKRSRSKVLEKLRESSSRMKESHTSKENKFVFDDKNPEKNIRDVNATNESHATRTRNVFNKKPEIDMRKKTHETDDEGSESDPGDEKRSRGTEREKRRKPTSMTKTESEIIGGKKDILNAEKHEHSSRRGSTAYESHGARPRKIVEETEIDRRKQRRDHYDDEISKSDIDVQKKNSGKLLEKLGKSSSRHRIESDVIHEKKHVHDKGSQAVSAAYESRGARSEKLVNESSKICTKKKRLDDTNSESSESDGGRKNTVVAKQNNHKKKVNPVSSSSSSDYSSATNSSDSSQSDASSDYSREKYGMKKTGRDYASRTDVSKAKQEQVVSSRTDRTKDKDARTARQSDEKTGRDYENRMGITKSKQEQEFSSRSDKKNDTNVKNDHHNDDKRSHLGHQHKTDRNNSGEPRRDHKDIDGGGSREERKRKVEDAGLSEQEGRDRESRDHRSYGRSQEDRRREDYPKSYEHEDKYERRGGTKEEQRYDDTKRRRFDDSLQHSTRGRRDRNFGDDSSGGHRR